MKMKTGKQQRIKKIKSWFFDKINNLIKFQPKQQHNKKREGERKTHNNNVRNKREDITTHHIDVKQIEMENYEQVYASKFVNFSELDQFHKKIISTKAH